MNYLFLIILIILMIICFIITIGWNKKYKKYKRDKESKKYTEKYYNENLFYEFWFSNGLGRDLSIALIFWILVMGWLGIETNYKSKQVEAEILEVKTNLVYLLNNLDWDNYYMVDKVLEQVNNFNNNIEYFKNTRKNILMGYIQYPCYDYINKINLDTYKDKIEKFNRDSINDSDFQVYKQTDEELASISSS